MGFFDSSTETTQKVPRWLRDEIKQTRDGFMNAADPTVYGGDWQAALNPYLSGAWENMYNNGQGNQFMGQMAGAANMGLGAMSQGMDYMTQLQNGGAPQFQYNQGVYDQTMSNLAPGIQANFDKGALDIQKGFDWNTLPGLNMENAFSGQMGGTKLGQATALGQSMADQNKMQFGLGLWNNASNQAQNAAMSAGQQNLNAGMNTQQGLLSGFNNYANMGIGSLNNAFNMNQGIFNNQLIAGQGQQGYDQQTADMLRAQHDANAWLPYQVAQDRFNTIANVANNFKTQSQSSNPSGFSNLMSGIGAIGTGASMFAGGGLGSIFGGGMNLTGSAGGMPYNLTGIGL